MRDRPLSLRPVIASALGCIAAVLLVAASTPTTTGCAALPGLEAAAATVAPALGQGLADLLKQQAQANGVPADDPTLKAMLVEAEALDAAQAKQAKALLSQQTAILKLLKQQRAACPSPAATSSPTTSPSASSPPPAVAADAGPAGADAGR